MEGRQESLGISDESRICVYDSDTKQQSTVWVFQDEPNSTKRIILHHDNSNCHLTVETTRFVEGPKIELTGHPPCSSDLAPNDFCLFPSVKNKLRGKRFTSREVAVDATKMHVLETLQSE
ncbi:hypothetical protein EVAR_81147_1 [Eumeta japonica]|uniref:Mariner Mos1 transposase n=1 Tax=Eumeta variegata TaxID=151549 RepID=A0A4C1ULD9_EUMVA|nr:hypothetical protein EVAR_81147_1 [Eumeta japonica]